MVIVSTWQNSFQRTDHLHWQIIFVCMKHALCNHAFVSIWTWKFGWISRHSLLIDELNSSFFFPSTLINSTFLVIFWHLWPAEKGWILQWPTMLLLILLCSLISLLKTLFFNWDYLNFLIKMLATNPTFPLLLHSLTFLHQLINDLMQNFIFYGMFLFATFLCQFLFFLNND